MKRKKNGNAKHIKKKKPNQIYQNLYENSTKTIWTDLNQFFFTISTKVLDVNDSSNFLNLRFLNINC